MIFEKIEKIISLRKGKKVSSVKAKGPDCLRYLQIEDLRNDNNLKYTDETDLVGVDYDNIVIAWDGSKAGTVSFNLEGIIGSTLAKITIKEEFKSKIIPQYLGRYLQFNYDYFQKTNTGATIPHVSKNALFKLEILLPDLETQNKIVAVLDKASALIQKREKSIEFLDELLRSTFLDMFEPDLINFKKENRSLEQIATIVSGVTKGRKTKETNFTEVPYLRVANAQDGYFNLDEIKTISATEKEIERYSVLKGDLLITEGGDPDKLGRGAIWELEDNKFIYQNHLFRIRLNNLEEYSPTWLAQIFASKYGKSYFLRQAKQTTGIATINKRQVSGFPIPKCSFIKQKEFEKLCLSIKQKKENLKKSLSLLSNLFNSILQKAFNGDLIFNIDIGLDALIDAEDKNTIRKDQSYLQGLIDKLENQEFEDLASYEKAKNILFQLLKEENSIEQKFIEDKEKLITTF